jgi:hypothetical protein
MNLPFSTNLEETDGAALMLYELVVMIEFTMSKVSYVFDPQHEAM